MTDLEVMKKAKTYIDKLANGINPLDDTPIAENDIINNVHLSRCLFYVSDVLRSVIENGGTVSSKKTSKEKFHVTFEEIQKFQFSDIPIPISEITKRINDITESENMKKLSHKNITEWLINVGMLKVITNPDGKNVKRPTTNGIELGITTEERTNFNGNYYTIVLYNRDAQHFIIDNMDAIIAMIN